VKDAAQGAAEGVAEDVPQDVAQDLAFGARATRAHQRRVFVQLKLSLGHNWAAQWHLARAVGKCFRGCRAKRLYIYLGALFSARAMSWLDPRSALRSENTRSATAELGVNKTRSAAPRPKHKFKNKPQLAYERHLGVVPPGPDPTPGARAAP